MIRFEDLISVPDPGKTKVKFNMNPNDSSKFAWDLLLNDDPEWIAMNGWKTRQANNNLKDARYLIALAQYRLRGLEYYAFGGLFEVEETKPEVFDGVGYRLTLLDDYKDYIKRLIVKIDKPIGRDTYTRHFEGLQDKLNMEVYEIRPPA